MKAQPQGDTPAPRSWEDLTLRQRRVLSLVIRRHVRTGEPVSSGAVSRALRGRWSPATIRAEMASLAEYGLLEQPHTSAGRVPTVAAYRLYVGMLLARGAWRRRSPNAEREWFDELADVHDLDAIMRTLGGKLAARTDLAAVVVWAHSALPVERIEFVPLSPAHVLVIVALQGGRHVVHHVATPSMPVKPEELRRAAETINRRYAGRSLCEIRDSLAAEVARARATLREALTMTSEAVDAASPQGSVHIAGAPQLLDRPEMQDLQRIRALFDALEERERWLRLLTAQEHPGTVTVFLDDDNPILGVGGFSVIAAGLTDDRILGRVALVGPVRMDYDALIPLVQSAARTARQLAQSRDGRRDAGDADTAHHAEEEARGG